jgi:predicted metal-dependent hydrolase
MDTIPIDELILSRRKTIALVVRPDGRLVVRAPLRTSQKIIDAFIASKTGWIEKTRLVQHTRHKSIPHHRFVNGEHFWYLGQQFPLRLVLPQRPALQFDLAFSLSENALKHARKRFEGWYREQARLYLTERVMYYSQRYNFCYQKIKITSARTRWGSCSARGTLSFAWRLIMAPPEIIDYVVLHELSHTVHHNHSQQFWALVQSIQPDYTEKRKWLKQHSQQFHWE